jgi:acetyl-CoA carboxylase biotin carboxylase subunit
MFKKILIANRGEIAVRVVRACREMGIASVAVYSEADRESLHVRLADEAVCIGPAPAGLSYLNQDALAAAMRMTGADAVHPGYGFLAENETFAKRVADEGLTFIGPKPSAIESLGDKVAARRLAAKAGVPTVPGSKGPVTEKTLREEVERIGFPIMIKASAGGGGKGMRRVYKPEELEASFRMAQNEARAAFGDENVYFERYVQQPRHVEIQIAADKFGKVVAFTERDCSVQRRHQKLIEESPSPVVTPEIREGLQSAAIKLAKAAAYTNVGTVEFLLDSEGRYYFLEVNTRLQVEHPVTELVCGIDLVQEQIRIAAGEHLSVDQEAAGRILGHAIEHRINAEDPETFAPCPGLVTKLTAPGGPGVRLDSHLYPGYTVPSFYDSLLGKLIVFAGDRDKAIARGLRALRELEIEGVKTTAPFHMKVLQHEDFVQNRADTSFLDRWNPAEKKKELVPA